ncbi:MAG: serine/threonine-protein kinase [Candidatus Sumerlaeota bacterium]|nr:serine/threonine-protein kinase [Candidatus Sumerlaeota bacterium]
MDYLIGQTLGGYRIEKKLGQGGMGTVFLARQLSLDRDVAIKIISPEFASDPVLLARFTREALSAARLNHHNIIQVYDVGCQGDLHYIAMEYVRGETIGAVVRQQSGLPIGEACGYTLQAARGLSFAHQFGIIHRDIKPDNLMINEHGFIKIADMGLAKFRREAESQSSASMSLEDTPSAGGADLTMAHGAMGTPAFMAPEQAKDASTVDERADQYSLGCTLYYLCSGKTPFSGDSAYEIITKHLKAPIPSLKTLLPQAPPELERIVKRMTEKDPNQRYPAMEDVIQDLEAYLDVGAVAQDSGSNEQHTKTLEEAIAAYGAAPAIRRRRWGAIGFFLAMPVLFALALAVNRFDLAGGALGLLALTPAAYFILHGIAAKDPLFRRMRHALFGMSAKGWLTLAGGATLALGVLALFGWLESWFACAVLAAGIAGGYQFLLVGRLRRERRASVEKALEAIRQLRGRGVSEEAIQDMVCRLSGRNWEEFYEDLFGYEAKVLARAKQAAAGEAKSLKKFGAWRDPLARWLEGIEAARNEARAHRHLIHVESRRMKSVGVADQEAKQEAEKQARQMLKEDKARKKEAAKSQKEESSQAVLPHFHRRLPWLAIAQGILGLFILAAWAMFRAAESQQGAIQAMFSSWLKPYYSWGAGSSAWCLIPGAALLITCFSRNIRCRAMIVIGAILMAAFHPILAAAGQSSAANAERLAQITGSIGFLLSAGGAALCFWSKMRTGKL